MASRSYSQIECSIVLGASGTGQIPILPAMFRRSEARGNMRAIDQRRTAAGDSHKDQSLGTTSRARQWQSGVGYAVSTLALHRAHVLLSPAHPATATPLQSFITDPNVLFILFGLAAIGLFFELSHPGATVPGVVGSIALIAFVVGALSLNPNWAGLILMLLAVVLLAVDVRITSHGVLTLAGLASLVIGSLIFFDTGSGPHVSTVSTYVVLGVAAGMGLVAMVVIRYAIASKRAPEISGTRGLLGQTGQVIVPLSPEGRVKVLGEDWAAELAPETAILNMTVAANQKVRVVAYDGLKLIVEPDPPVYDDILGFILRHAAFKPNGKPLEPGDSTPILEADQHVTEQ